jgi:hypothetical protein
MFSSKCLKILYVQSRDGLLEELLKEPDEITIKRKQIHENVMVLQQAYKVWIDSCLNFSLKEIPLVALF